MPVFECPTCGKELRVERREDAPYRPFCCRRCKLVDLGRWLDGTYCISEPLTGSFPETPKAAEDED
ncbi:MAG: DNA gyrase inhibitor YacG [Phycisphaerae bacterium]|nr:MAG: DNA gyrase inhibitor YacG [Planctomycetota bacterium]KAB2944969.1 MAG: DNA gyrase inhibitor YacG [Phycisphaerae bacterium]MBE7456736.1 DNA gyrase inhibitor YacG [Planctomycetia bacterium]MCK6463888.1 DNA gyrase inhibitor YacG [Phycisphaerae bacterium]MCL4718100.1 DNA gyrase inhibitor YacG [Phycisphaerae bacterium]